MLLHYSYVAKVRGTRCGSGVLHLAGSWPKPLRRSSIWIGFCRPIGHPLDVQDPVGWREAQSEIGCRVWLKTSWIAEVGCKVLDALLENLDLILWARKGCCGDICMWHICFGRTRDREEENQQRYELSSISTSRNIFLPAEQGVPTWACWDETSLNECYAIWDCEGIEVSLCRVTLKRSPRRGALGILAKHEVRQVIVRVATVCLHCISNMQAVPNGPSAWGCCCLIPGLWDLALPLLSLQPIDAGLRWKHIRKACVSCPW